MSSRRPQLLALGGYGFTDAAAAPLDDYALSLTGAERPRICLIATASGDASPYVAAFYRHFGRRAQVTHLSLFQRDADPAEVVAEQDLLYVGGGNTANLLALWRLHGLDAVVRDAYGAGVVLVGVSAGACALLDGGVSASFGALAPLSGGLGLVAGAFAPHWPERGAILTASLGEGRGWGASEGAALHFADGELREAVGVGAQAEAFRVDPGPSLHALAVRRLDVRAP